MIGPLNQQVKLSPRTITHLHLAHFQGAWVANIDRPGSRKNGCKGIEDARSCSSRIGATNGELCFESRSL